jgi:hypothetical protein
MECTLDEKTKAAGIQPEPDQRIEDLSEDQFSDSHGAKQAKCSAWKQPDRNSILTVDNFLK